MSKLDKLLNELKALEGRLKDIDEEREVIKQEIEDKKEMVDIINEILDEQKEAYQEAYATLITQRDNEGKITDSDFLCFSDTTGIGVSGLIDRPVSEDAENQEVEKIPLPDVAVA